MTHKKGTLIWRILIIVFATVFLSALLTVLIFSKIGASVMADVQAEELLPKAMHIGRTTEKYLEGRMTEDEYMNILGENENIWDASLHAVSLDGEPIASCCNEDLPNEQELIKSNLENVAAGEIVVDNDDIMVGVPVRNESGEVIAAVFLIKSISELQQNLQGVTRALFLSMGFVIVVMMIPSYAAFRGVVNPIRQMTRIASGISEGNFTLKAPENAPGELATLGRSLNHLSRSLSTNISDLTFERNRLRSILDSMSEGLIALDADGNLSHCNIAASKLLGVCGKKLNRDLPIVQRIYEMAEVLCGKRDMNLLQNVQRVADNELISTIEIGEMNIKISVSSVTDEDGVYAGAVAVLADITEEMRFEQARRDYVANVSHELRTPIASIRGLADALNDGLVKNELTKQRYYGHILNESNRLSRLIDDLLELSRLQSGKLAFQHMQTDLVETVMYVADRFKDTADNSRREITINIEDSLPYAWTNPDRAEQILVVLLDNAVRHTEEGTDVEVIARRMRDDDRRDAQAALGTELDADAERNKLIVQVKNTGEIDEADIKHLFDRFYKVDKSHSSGGTGLGLAIAKEVMDILGENIWVVSRDGTVCFSFTLEIFDESVHQPDGI